jgi:SH3 domain protein
MFFRKAVYFLCLLSLFSVPALAETGYVTDQLVITLRQGKGNQYKIIRTLKTGTPMEILEKGDTYYRVRIRSGEEGYVLRQYVSTSTPKPVIIANLKKQVAGLKRKIQELEGARNELKEKNTDLAQNSQTEIEQLKQQLADLQEKYNLTTQKLESVNKDYTSLIAKSENLLSIIAERDKLATENEKLSARAQELKVENSDLLRTGVIKWFLAGAGVLFFGWILGKLSRKRRSTF